MNRQPKYCGAKSLRDLMHVSLVKNFSDPYVTGDPCEHMESEL